jgi:hypothetical protein
MSFVVRTSNLTGHPIFDEIACVIKLRLVIPMVTSDGHQHEQKTGRVGIRQANFWQIIDRSVNTARRFAI